MHFSNGIWFFLNSSSMNNIGEEVTSFSYQHVNEVNDHWNAHVSTSTHDLLPTLPYSYRSETRKRSNLPQLPILYTEPSSFCRSKIMLHFWGNSLYSAIKTFIQFTIMRPWLFLNSLTNIIVCRFGEFISESMKYLRFFLSDFLLVGIICLLNSSSTVGSD